MLSCTGLLSPNGDNKAYLFITIYTMSLENVEFFVLIIQDDLLVLQKLRQYLFPIKHSR